MDKKYTVILDEELVNRVAEDLDTNVTDAIRTALKQMRSAQAQHALLKMRGKFPKMKLSDVRDKED